MNFRSVRVTLTLWYIGILGAILILFGWGLYTSVSTNLYQKIDEVLSLQADGVADTLLAFWEAESEQQDEVIVSYRKGRRSVPSLTLQREIDEGRFPDLVGRWAREISETQFDHPIRIISRDGTILHTSGIFHKTDLPLTATVLKRAKAGQVAYETFEIQENHWRLITMPVIEEKRVLYFVQTFTSLRQGDTSLDRLQRWLFVLVPLTLLGASLGGWFLARIAFDPVAQMIGQAAKIGVEHLHERISVPKTGDELERLATTFNDLLARLERAFRRLRQFSAAASHELRTPLTVMKGELEVALRRPRDVEEYQRVLRTQLESLNEMALIVQQLLILARSDGGAGAVEWRRIELSELIQHICHGRELIAEAKQVLVQVEASGTFWVRGEQRLLESLVSNLLDNALKHTPSGGEIKVQLAAQGGEVCLTVRDTGPGIPPEDLPNIFDRFFQRPIAQASADSTGLGLGLCRWIAEAHRGKIEASSLPGGGALFSVRLPLT